MVKRTQYRTPRTMNEIKAAILELLTTRSVRSRDELVDLVGGKAGRVRAALDALIADGLISRPRGAWIARVGSDPVRPLARPVIGHGKDGVVNTEPTTPQPEPDPEPTPAEQEIPLAADAAFAARLRAAGADESYIADALAQIQAVRDLATRQTELAHELLSQYRLDADAAQRVMLDLVDTGNVTDETWLQMVGARARIELHTVEALN